MDDSSEPLHNADALYKIVCWRIERKAAESGLDENGAAGENRTPDLSITNGVLYR